MLDPISRHISKNPDVFDFARNVQLIELGNYHLKPGNGYLMLGNGYLKEGDVYMFDNSYSKLRKFYLNCCGVANDEG